jgi:2-iminobutanoate/2-iminopropanoate deaminase
MNSTRRTLMAALPLAASASAARKTSAKRVYYPNGKPASTPIYSEVIGLNNLVFVSGHGVDTPKDIKGQTKAVLDKIEACLKSAGSSMEKVVKCNVFLRHLEDYAAMNEAYLGRFGTEPPVRTTVAVAGIPLEGCLVEMEVMAER